MSILSRPEKIKQLQYDLVKSFRADLNSCSGLSENRMITSKPTIFAAFGSARKRITTLMTVETFQPFELVDRNWRHTYATKLLSAAVLSMLFTVHAATAPVELITHPATLQFLNKEKAQIMHNAADPLDDSYGDVPLPKARPDYASIWSGRIVGVAGPAGRPDILDMLPESTRELADMVRQQTGQTVLSETKFTLSAGDTLAKILLKANFTNQDVAYVSEALSRHLNLRRLQIGTEFTAGLDEDKRAIALKVSLPTSQQTSSKAGNIFLDHYVLRDSPEDAELSWHAIKAVRPVDRAAVHAGNEIDLSLYEAARQVNIPLDAFDKFVRVMSFSVDFQRDIQRGDQFELVYEKTVDRLTGDVLSSGKLNYAGIILSGKRMGYYRFTHPDGQIGWYDRNGKSAVRTLMRTPVNGARLSSRYGMRRHPVTGFNAMHRGIDFAVPTGTPILAAGSGSVEAAGWNGNYGKYVRIRHNSTYKTAYAHMSRIAPGISKGRKITQGEVIGYVGSTGRSTGPHLHYEIMVNNRQVNPMTVQLPAGKGVPNDQMQAFSDAVKAIEKQMKDSLTPDYVGVTLQQAALER